MSKIIAVAPSPTTEGSVLPKPPTATINGMPIVTVGDPAIHTKYGSDVVIESIPGITLNGKPICTVGATTALGQKNKKLEVMKSEVRSKVKPKTDNRQPTTNNQQPKKNMKHILYLFITTIALLSCNGQDDKIAAFHNQKHRFEVRGCEFFYNDQKIELYTPKSNFSKLFGDDFDPDDPDYHNSVPIYISEQIRSLQEKHIRDVSSIWIRLWHALPSDKYFEENKNVPTIGLGRYILIDGVPFGNGISINELNENLQKLGKQEFSNDFAGTSDIKGRGHLECENFPQFFINYYENGRLESFTYLIKKPKNLK